MGMYTTIEDVNLEIVDKEGLIEYIKDANAGKYPYTGEWLHNIDPEDLAESITDNWNDCKIISYWYDELVAVLRDLAVFVNGTIDLRFENNEEAGWIEFSKGICIIHTGQTMWAEERADNFLEEPKATEKNKVDYSMPKELQKRLMLRRI